METTVKSTFVWTLVLVLLSTSSVATMNAGATNHQGEPNSVTFEQPNGVMFAEWVNLSGTSAQPLRDTAWSIVNISGPTPITVLEGPYLTAVRPLAEDTYEWELSVYVGQVDCTCYVKLDVQEHAGERGTSAQIVYLGDRHHRPVFLDEDFASAQTSGGQDTRFVVNAVEVVDLDIVLPGQNSSAMQVTGSLCEAPYGVCLGTPIQQLLPFSLVEETLRLELNATQLGLHEGLWRIDVHVTDGLLRSSHDVRLHLLHDSTAPMVNIVSPESVFEREAFNVFANGNDGYDGSSYSVTWVLTEPDGTVRAPSTAERVSDQHLVLIFEQSGTYRIEASVRDLAGNTGMMFAEILVLNVQPVAVVTVDGLVVETDATLVLGPDQNWSINGNASQDNEQIDFLWVIDDARSIRSVASLIRSDFVDARTYEVELIVFDDDGSSDSKRFRLVVVDPTPVQEVSGAVSSSAMVALVMVIVACLLWFVRQRKESESDLPKWKPTESHLTTEYSEETVRFDATVEEDEPRG